MDGLITHCIWRLFGLAILVLFHELNCTDVFLGSGEAVLRYQDGNLSTPIGQDSGRVAALTLDGRAGVIFWSDISRERRGIYRTNTRHFTPVVTIQRAVSHVAGLSADTSSGLLFWTDEWRGTVEVSRYDGSYRHIIVATRLSLPRPVLVLEGYVYWGDQGTGRIERSRMDGSGRETVVKNVLRPNQLAWDQRARTILWTDGWSNHVMQSKLDGNETVFADLSVMCNTSSLFGLVVQDDQYLVTLTNGSVLSMTSTEAGARADVGTKEVHTLVQNTTTSDFVPIASWSPLSTTETSDACLTVEGRACSHLCLPIGHSRRQCACPSYGGLSLVNETTCDVPAEILLYVSTNGGVGFIGLNEPHPTRTNMIDISRQPMALAYDPVDQVVFYSDARDNRIYRVAFAGSRRKVLLDSDDGIGIVDDLAVDPIQRHLYFTNRGAVRSNGTTYTWHRIEMIRIDAPARRFVLAQTDARAHALTVDAEEGWVYYTQRNNTKEVIWRMKLDGSEPNPMKLDLADRVFVSAMSISRSSGTSSLFVVTSEHPYLNNNQSWNLRRLDDEGKSVITARYADIDRPVSLTAKEDKLFFLYKASGKVWRLDTNSGDHTQFDDVFASRILYSVQSMSRAVISRCKSDCEDSCVRVPDRDSPPTDSCLCAANSPSVLSADLRACEEPKLSLVFADVDSIKMVPHGNSTSDDPITTHTLLQRSTRDSNLVALAYDDITGRLFFSDNRRGAIYVADSGGEKPVLFYSHGPAANDRIQTIDGMAIDRVSPTRRLMWTVYNKGLICAVDISGDSATFREIVTGLRNPRALIVDERTSLIFWSECGPGSAVRGASLDGENQFTVMDTDLAWPNSILLHPENRQLFVADGGSGVIHNCSLSASGDWECDVLFALDTHLFGMTYANDHLYVTSWNTASVEQIGLLTGERKRVVGALTRPTQLILVRRRDVPPGCEDNRSDCGLSDRFGGQDTPTNLVVILASVGGAVSFLALLVLLWWLSRRVARRGRTSVGVNCDHIRLCRSDERLASEPIMMSDLQE